MTDSLPNRPTRARIDLDALASNYRSSKSFIGGGSKIMAVVKADAYGHGAVPCASRLEQEGADWFGVATAEEAIELRAGGILAPILCLGGVWSGQEGQLIDKDIAVAIFRIEHAEQLDRAAATLGIKARVHVKFDTGMGRVGVQPEQAQEFAERLMKLENLEVQGLMTHFAVADDLNQTDFTSSQISAFDECVEMFRRVGHEPSLLSVANSPGAVAHPDSRKNLVRLGGILYGLGGDVLPKNAPAPSLKPVMRIETVIADIKEFDSGESIGYGRTFTTVRESRIALIPIGYHDGLPRALSNLGHVIVRGKLAPIVGRVSMDWTLVDVTEIPEAIYKDSVTVIGTDGSARISAEDIAISTGTISYEITCGIGARVPRFYD